MKILRDGYWDRTDLIELKNSTLRVRKVTKGADTPGLWGVSTLRSEIQYMCFLDKNTARYFPRIYSVWDNEQSIGYEIEYLSDAVVASELIQSGNISQAQANLFQDKLALIVFDKLHMPTAEDIQPLSEHIMHIFNRALEPVA